MTYRFGVPSANPAHWPPLPGILCGHIWAMQALLDMGFGQNWRSANSYSQIGHLGRTAPKVKACRRGSRAIRIGGR
jgi:hypothetical protein